MQPEPRQDSGLRERPKAHYYGASVACSIGIVFRAWSRRTKKGWKEESGKDCLKAKDYLFATLVSGSGAE
jgi:hypothetical protein